MSGTAVNWDAQGWEAMRHDGTAYLDDAEPTAPVFDYCDHCCKQPMRANSAYCSNLCEGRAAGLICSTCPEPLKGRDELRQCFACRMQALES